MSEALGRIEGMDLLAQHLEDLRSQALAVLRAADAGRAFERASEGELALQLAAIAEVNRLAEALLIDAVGEVARRSGAAVRDDRMTSHLGCRDVVELVQQITRVAPHTAARLQRAALTVRPEISDTTGEKLAAPFPAVRAAMLDGIADRLESVSREAWTTFRPFLPTRKNPAGIYDRTLIDAEVEKSWAAVRDKA